MKILVRSRKDASALTHTVKRILKDETIIVESIGGSHGSTLCDAIRERVEPFTIVILGRNYRDLCSEEDVLGSTPFTSLVFSRTRKPRNSTLEMLASLVSWGKAWIRMDTWWSSGFVISRGSGERLRGLRVHPEGDVFLLSGVGLLRFLRFSGLTDMINSINKRDIGILVKEPEGIHTLYLNKSPLLRVKISKMRESFSMIERLGEPTRLIDNLSLIVERNKFYIDLLEKYSINIIKNNIKTRKVIVPLSGGKDSAASLLLATKAFGPENVKAIYVDTGIDFDLNREYSANLASKLGVEFYTVQAEIDQKLVNGYPLPTPENRWCTKLKLSALSNIIKKISNNDHIIIVGDRDAESPRRGSRPIVRNDELTGLKAVAPLKYWSGMHVLLYLYNKGIEPNPLYIEGFLRIGCYLCFALRGSWEIRILKDMSFYKNLINKKKKLKQYIESFLSLHASTDSNREGNEK